MRRREFLAASAATAAGSLIPRFSWAADVPGDIKIVRVVSMELEYTRPKHIGKNSYRHDHGTKAYDRLVRLYTNNGLEGVGTCWSGANECAAFLGKSPLEFFNREQRKVAGPLVRYTSPMWDLVGKILHKPVWQLLADPAAKPLDKKSSRPGEVAVYDGAIYMTDLRPQHLADWRDEFKRELDRTMAMGHRAMKVKIGRGKLWMRTEEGYQRDLEVVRHMREHVGPDFLIGVDANDGYDFERTKRFVADSADLNIAFIEEMFPEDVAKWQELRAFMKEKGLNILIADGENKRLPADMKSWTDARSVDILQGDMNLFGFEDIMAEAAMAAPYGGMVAPHNWGSLFGYYLQVQVGRALPNFYRAEQDPMSNPAVLAEGYRIRDGYTTLPEAPGLGITIHDAALGDTANVHFDLKA